MAKKIVNLTQQAVVKEVERALVGYPDHPHQQAFANPELRQKLIVHVLNHSHNRFTLIEAEEEPKVDPEVVKQSLDQQPDVNTLIHQGIQTLLIENSDWVSLHIPDAVDAGRSCSHWFG